MATSARGAREADPRAANGSAAALRVVRCLEQKPRSPLGLVDEVFQQACAGHVAMLVAKACVSRSRAVRSLLSSRNSASISSGVTKSASLSMIALQAADMADRAQRRAADLADALCERVGGSENLVGLLVKQQMIVAEMWTGDVPMEVLGFQVQREHVRQQDVQRCRRCLRPHWFAGPSASQARRCEGLWRLGYS